LLLFGFLGFIRSFRCVACSRRSLCCASSLLFLCVLLLARFAVAPVWWRRFFPS